MILIVHRSRDSRKVQCYVGLTRMHSSRMSTARSSTVMGGLRDREPPWRGTPHPLDRDPPPVDRQSPFCSLFSGNLYCLFLVVWSGFCFRILSAKAIKVIIFPSLDQSFHLDITNCLFAINNRRWRIWGLVMKSEEAHKASFFLNGDWVKADNSPFCSWTFDNMKSA